MKEVTTVGLDIAKHVFQVHGVDQDGNAVLRRKLRRTEVVSFFNQLSPCLIGIEACATAHHWARVLGPVDKVWEPYLCGGQGKEC